MALVRNRWWICVLRRRLKGRRSGHARTSAVTPVSYILLEPLPEIKSACITDVLCHTGAQCHTLRVTTPCRFINASLTPDLSSCTTEASKFTLCRKVTTAPSGQSDNIWLDFSGSNNIFKAKLEASDIRRRRRRETRVDKIKMAVVTAVV